MANEPVRITVTDPDLRRTRLTVLLRLILALPHLILLVLVGALGVLLAPFYWLAALWKGRAPTVLADYYRELVRYGLHLYAYLSIAADPYPPFLGAEKRYAVEAEFPRDERQSRWSIGVRLILALPALLLATAFVGGGLDVGGGAGVLQSVGVLSGVAVLAWFAALATGRAPQGLRDLSVYAIGYATQAWSYLLLLTDRYPDAAPSAYPASPMPRHPVTLSLRQDDLRRSRLTTFFRVLLAVPHIVWLALWTVVATLGAVGAWLAALASGRVPDALHRFLAAYVRYVTHVSTFLYLTASPFPGFTGAPGSYPADIEIAPPEPQRRLAVLFRLVLALPAILVWSGLSGLWFLTAVFGWWAALFTGRMPRNLREAGAYVARYYAQMLAYLLLLTPRYPYAGPGPGTADPAASSATPAWSPQPEAP